MKPRSSSLPLSLILLLLELNLSHIIHKMSFGADFPGIQNPLDKFVEAALHRNPCHPLIPFLLTFLFHPSLLHVSIFY